MADALKEWCQRKDGRTPSGAVVIPFFGDGFAIQYLGSEQLTAAELVERVRWIAERL